MSTVEVEIMSSLVGDSDSESKVGISSVAKTRPALGIEQTEVGRPKVSKDLNRLSKYQMLNC